MIRITIELVPYGDESRRKIIASGKIANDDTGTLKRGNYVANLHLKQKKCWKIGGVRDFPRQSKNVWYLVKKVLEELL